MEKESFFRPPSESIEVKTWKEFKMAIDGWVCFDGNDYCSKCYEKIATKLKGEGQAEESISSCAEPLAKLLDHRKTTDGCLVECQDCQKSVFRQTLKDKYF